MRRKLGRNAPCWCGSGEKYKRCHLNRDRQEPIKWWDASKKLKEAFGAKDCLVPAPLKGDCSPVVVRAHSVPRGGSLSQIARDGHVYSFIPSLDNLIRHDGVVPAELVGVKKASTFTGFCSVHDNAIFAPLEQERFNGSQEHCFLLGYRALARELFTKTALASLSPLRGELDRGRSPDQQLAIQKRKVWFDIGASAGLRDNQFHKDNYDHVLLSRDFASVRAYVIELESAPPIMCSGGIFPEQDFDGNDLQDLGDLSMTPDVLNFSSFYGGEGGAIVFTWLPDSDRACRAFVDSLRATQSDRLTDTLIRFFFESCENLHMQPSWWETLSEHQRAALIDRMANSANPELARHSGCLIDDGLRFEGWTYSDSRVVGFR